MTATEREEREREAEEMGCSGLVEGWARHLYTQEIFYASQCRKSDGPFYCPECASDAVVRKCSEKKDHFAHKARLSPVIGPEEGELHKQCKNEIASLLQKRFPEGNWATERTIPESKDKKVPELRPDVSGRIQGVRVAVEVQASTLTVPKIIKRVRDYTKRGIALLWLVPLREPLDELPFRPRLYERYLHSIYYGRTYYWWADQGLVVKPVHYGAEVRNVEYKEWYENGEHMEGGGYATKYRIIKKPMYGTDINIADNFMQHLRGEFLPENERKAIPQCLFWRDTLKEWWSDR